MEGKDKQIAFMNLFKPVHNRLSRFAMALTRNSEDARDLVSETVLIAYQKFESIKNTDSIASWLFSVASRLHRRKKWRQRLFGKFEAEKAEQIQSNNLSADIMLDIQILYAALAKLPRKQCEAIILFEISGFKLEEIREIQGGTISGVKTRLKRAREALAKLLSSDFGIIYEKFYKRINGDEEEIHKPRKNLDGTSKETESSRAQDEITKVLANSTVIND